MCPMHRVAAVADAFFEGAAPGELSAASSAQALLASLLSALPVTRQMRQSGMTTAPIDS